MLDHVTWMLPSHVLCVQFSEHMDRAQIQEMNQRCFNAFQNNASAYTVHIIIDVSRVTHYEHDILHEPLFQEMRGSPWQIEWIVVVDPHPNAILRFVGLTLTSLMRFRSHVAKSYDEAVTFLTPRMP